MMALATVHLQGCCSSFPYVPSARSRGSQPKSFLTSLPVHSVRRKVRLSSLKLRSCSRRAPFVVAPKSEIFKISAFKGGNCHDGSGSKANGSKSLKNPVQVSFIQHESEESFLESPKTQNVVPGPYTAEDETTTSYLGIQNLFKNWLMLLHTPQRTPQLGGALEEPAEETSEEPKAVQKSESRKVFKAALHNFWALDSTIKIPILVFGPLYLAVNLVYGSEVSKELTPLWILGPLVVALYLKMLRGICSLYVFSFKQTVKVVKSLPACYMLVYEYLFRGKLKEAMPKYLWKPLVDIKELDYKELTMRKWKDFKGWLWEKCLDFFESIWPTYCRTIRFLKRANLI